MPVIKIHTEEDSVLLYKLSRGDKNAFDSLYNKYWEQVFDAAFKRLDHAEQAKDITQDVFAKLWIRRADIVIRNLPAYLHVAVKNRAYNLMEHEKKYVPVPDLLLELESLQDRGDAQLLYGELKKGYEAVLKTLPDQQSIIFRMRYSDELSTAEIANQLNLSPKTVRNHLGKALVKIRVSLIRLFYLFILVGLSY